MRRGDVTHFRADVFSPTAEAPAPMQSLWNYRAVNLRSQPRLLCARRTSAAALLPLLPKRAQKFRQRNETFRRPEESPVARNEMPVLPRPKVRLGPCTKTQLKQGRQLTAPKPPIGIFQFPRPSFPSDRSFTAWYRRTPFSYRVRCSSHDGIFSGASANKPPSSSPPPSRNQYRNIRNEYRSPMGSVETNETRWPGVPENRCACLKSPSPLINRETKEQVGRKRHHPFPFSTSDRTSKTRIVTRG